MKTQYQIIYWRDIPAQVKIRGTEIRTARELSPRFQEAIDEAAMRTNLFGTDDYLAMWRMSKWQEREGEPRSLAESIAAELEAAFPPDRLKRLILNGGTEPQ